VINANAMGVVLLTAEATVYGRRRVDSLWYTVGAPLRVVCSYGTGEYEIFVGSGGISAPTTNSLSLGALMVGQGGAILWGNSTHGFSDDSLDIQFDDTMGIAGLIAPTTFWGRLGPIISPEGRGGNIPAFPAAVQITYVEYPGWIDVFYDSTSSRARLFTRPGTYHWSSVHRGIHGTVTVVSNDSLHRK
jgi:hypothetical protein